MPKKTPVDHSDTHKRIGELAAQAGALQQQLAALDEQQHAIVGKRTVIERRLNDLQTEATRLVQQVTAK